MIEMVPVSPIDVKQDQDNKDGIYPVSNLIAMPA
jgi:hypothetical protein